MSEQHYQALRSSVNVYEANEEAKLLTIYQRQLIMLSAYPDSIRDDVFTSPRNLYMSKYILEHVLLQH